MKKTESEKEEKAKMVSGRKHHDADKGEGESTEMNPVKKVTASTSYGKTQSPLLCMFDLRHQFLHAKEGCKKMEQCSRDHFDKSMKKVVDYHWSYDNVSRAVMNASTKVLSTKEKREIMEAMSECLT
jgi:hypothetical protein